MAIQHETVDVGNKTSETQLAGYEKVRFSNCRGGVVHCNARTKAVVLKKSMACVTIDSLTRKLMLVGCVENRTNIFRVLPGNILQSGRRNYLCIIAVNTHVHSQHILNVRRMMFVVRSLRIQMPHLLKFKPVSSSQSYGNVATGLR